MSKLKRLAGDTVLYGLGSILPRMLNYLLVPLHTKNMFSTAEYGEITKLYAFVGVINIIYMFGMETAYFRFATKPGSDSKRIFNLAQTSVIIISGAITLLLIAFATPITASLQISNSQFVTWLALTMFVDAIVAIPFARLRLEKRPLLFASAKIINVLVLVGLNYYFLKISFDPAVGIGYVFMANLLANAFFLLFFIKTLISWRPAWDKSLSPQMFQYAYPVMITGVAGMINEMFSRSMLDWRLPQNFYAGISGKEAGGIFGACYKFAVFMNLGIQAFRYAAEPFFFSNAHEKNSPTLFAKVNHYFVVTCCVVLLGISINLDIFKYFIGENFWSGLSIVPVLLLAYLFLGIYYNLSVWFKLTDKTYFGTFITLLGVVVTIAGNFILIPIMGFMGSALAALGCYSIMAISCYFLGQRNYPIPYTVTRDMGYIIFTYAVLTLVNKVAIDNQWLATGFHTVVILAFLAFIYLVERKNFSKPIV
ncbi:MAG TPA: polysaccharide biosynthesis C-terminal domain-containing protein [Cyclobacteriaceae bacterium]|nr:polysaccharide biosynthesis C-terminal domain-containing protein [Cyclobacteriaceae bacterium]